MNENRKVGKVMKGGQFVTVLISYKERSRNVHMAMILRNTVFTIQSHREMSSFTFLFNV